MLKEDDSLYQKFNHIQDGWSETEKPLPVNRAFTNQIAWQNHPWRKEFGWLIDGIVVRDFP